MEDYGKQFEFQLTKIEIDSTSDDIILPIYFSYCINMKKQILVTGGISFYKNPNSESKEQQILNNEQNSFLIELREDGPNRYLKFKNVAPMKINRIGHKMFSIDRFCYAVGGTQIIQEFKENEIPSNMKECEQFDIVKQAWTDIAPMNQPRSRFSGLVFQKKIYVFGGFKNQIQEAIELNTEFYDPNQNKWTQINWKKPMGQPQNYFASCGCVSTGNEVQQILILGGANGEESYSNINQVEGVDKSKINFIQTMKVNRANMNVIPVNNKLIIFGGTDEIWLEILQVDVKLQGKKYKLDILDNEKFSVDINGLFKENNLSSFSSQLLNSLGNPIIGLK